MRQSSPRLFDDSETVWSVCGPESLSWRDWGGDTIIYHPLSGDTQLLDIAVAEVLKLISERRAKRGEIREQLASFLEVDNDSELDKAVSQILGKLDDLGIIEPVPT